VETEDADAAGSRGATAIHRYGASWLGPALVSGQGCRVTTSTARPTLTARRRPGHWRWAITTPEVIEAAVAQIRTLAHARAGFPTIPRLLLAKRLADLCPGHLKKVVNAPTGSLAGRGRHETGTDQPSRRPSFHHVLPRLHGSTLATMAAGWMPTQTPGRFGPGVKFLPFMQNIVRVPNPYCYRCPLSLTYPTCNAACAAPLRDTIVRG